MNSNGQIKKGWGTKHKSGTLAYQAVCSDRQTLISRVHFMALSVPQEGATFAQIYCDKGLQ